MRVRSSTSSTFEEAVDRGLRGDRGALEEAARLYKGDVLPDCTSDWIGADRERLRQRATSALRRLIALLEQEQAFGEAIEHAQQLCRLDPLDEDAWCALMRCHARRGERATALHLYQQCAALLKKELGVQPSAATRMTYREILDLDAAAPVVLASPRTAGLSPARPPGRVERAPWCMARGRSRSSAAFPDPG